MTFKIADIPENLAFCAVLSDDVIQTNVTVVRNYVIRCCLN